MDDQQRDGVGRLLHRPMLAWFNTAPGGPAVLVPDMREMTVAELAVFLIGNIFNLVVAVLFVCVLAIVAIALIVTGLHLLSG